MIMHSMGFTNALDISQQYLYLGIMDGISNNILIVIEFILKVTEYRHPVYCCIKLTYHSLTYYYLDVLVPLIFNSDII